MTVSEVLCCLYMKNSEIHKSSPALSSEIQMCFPEHLLSISRWVLLAFPAGHVRSLQSLSDLTVCDSS